MRQQGTERGLPLRRGGGTSLAAHMATEVDKRIQGRTMGANGQLFSALTHADVGPATRNANFWGADLMGSLTGCSPSNSASNELEAVTLITPRHCIGIKHGAGYPADGSSVRFVQTDNTMVARTISAHLELAAHDLTVMRLSADVPGTILPLKVAPDDISLWLPSSFNVPVMTLDQEEKGLVADMYTRFPGGVFIKEPGNASRRAFYEGAVPGDSGDPFLGIINGEWVIFGFFTNPDNGPSPAGIIAAIDAAITTLGGGGACSTPDLSGFTKH